MLMPYDPQSDGNADETGSESDPIRGAVAIQSFVTGSFAIGLDDAITIIGSAVEEIENIGRDDRAQRHEAPILAEAVDAKCFGDDGWKDAEKETVAQTRETRDEAKKVGVLDIESAGLCDEKYEAGQYQTPNATDMHDFDQIIGAHS